MFWKNSVVRSIILIICFGVVSSAVKTFYQVDKRYKIKVTLGNLEYLRNQVIEYNRLCGTNLDNFSSFTLLNPDPNCSSWEPISGRSFVDGWGHSITLVVEGATVIIKSPGPNGRFDTDSKSDDFVLRFKPSREGDH